MNAATTSLYAELATALMVATREFWPARVGPHFMYACFQEDPSDAVIVSADEAGFEYLSSGNFTAVFRHPSAPGVVFKLNAGTLDRMQEYHEWLMTQDHENLPRVYHVETFDEGCCAVAEELTPGRWDEPGNGAGDAYDAVEAIIEAAGFAVDDTHAGNYMMRGDTWVLNDPSSNRNASDDDDDDEWDVDEWDEGEECDCTESCCS